MHIPGASCPSNNFLLLGKSLLAEWIRLICRLNLKFSAVEQSTFLHNSAYNAKKLGNICWKIRFLNWISSLKYKKTRKFTSSIVFRVNTIQKVMNIMNIMNIMATLAKESVLSITTITDPNMYEEQLGPLFKFFE